MLFVLYNARYLADGTSVQKLLFLLPVAESQIVSNPLL
jgi:hypothetical protein